MKINEFNWILFDSLHPPICLPFANDYLLLIREKHGSEETSDRYFIDLGCPYGYYLSNFWDVSNSKFNDPSKFEVLAYAEPYCQISESNLKDILWSIKCKLNL